MATLEDLDKLQQEMYHEAVEIPENQEQELIDVTQNVANRLYFHPNQEAEFEFLKHQYRVKYFSTVYDFKKYMAFVIDDLTDKVRIKEQIEVNNSLTEIENIRAALSAGLRHHIGEVDVGEINEE